MPKRAANKPARDPRQKPNTSRYATKRSQRLQEAKVTGGSQQASSSQEVKRPAQTTRILPAGARLSHAKLIANKLQSGYVFLADENGERVYLSDSVLARFDPNYIFQPDATIECAVATGRNGLRALEVYNITPPH